MSDTWVAAYRVGDFVVEARITRTSANYQLTWDIKPGMDRQMVGFATLAEAQRAFLCHLEARGIDTDGIVFRELPD